MSARMIDKTRCRFSVWAPEKEIMILHLLREDRRVTMTKDEWGYFILDAEEVRAGDLYYFSPDGLGDLPDPASQYQPRGVHGPSAVVDHQSYDWRDVAWRGAALSELIFYELHVGTFTAEGTFAAILPRLDDLVDLGINAIELMPVAQFPGERNWGYDGSYIYAVQNSYGGPSGLKELVDACHHRGLSVILDVVYNHIGPEGNYLDRFGPYFTDGYHTPWGRALNFDGCWSDGVREFVIGNTLHWFDHYHIDGLRVDAIHEVYDRNAISIWEDIHGRVKTLEKHAGRPLHLIAESDLNSPRVIRPPEAGGFGFDAQWLDDFHHALYVLLSPEGLDHYQDFGRLEQLVKAFQAGFVHSGDYVRFRKRKHGASSAGIPGDRFVVFCQNHDLPGNRPGGERLSKLVDMQRLKVAAALVLLSPYLPLLFMGEEYGEDAPFFFFSDYGEQKVTQQLLEGRKTQFAGFGWIQEPPDPQDRETFLRSKLNWEKRQQGGHAPLLDWYRRLIGLRSTEALLKDFSRDNLRVDPIGRSGLAVFRSAHAGTEQLLCLFNLGSEAIDFTFSYGGEVVWTRILDSRDALYDEPPEVPGGTSIGLYPYGVCVYRASVPHRIAAL